MSSNDKVAQRPAQGDGPPHINIQIDREHFKVKDTSLSGAQLRNLPTTPIQPNRDLFQVVPGGSDVKINDSDSVALKSGMRFFTAPSQINPGSTTAL